MNCCGLSSTGLNDINANNITSDNITIYSNLNVSGFSNLNELLVDNNVSFISSLNVSGFTTLNKTTILSSLNVSGFTNLNNTTNINGSLYISGLNVLSTLNSYSTSLTSLYSSTEEIENVLITLGTGLSTLNNFRSDNESALITQESTTFSTLIHGVYPGSEIKFDTVLSKSNVISQGTGTEYLTKIDSNGKLCVYHPYNVLLPQKLAGYWIIHDEIEGLEKQAIIDAAKFLAHDILIEGVGGVATGAAQGVAAISLYLGISDILDIITGGGDPPDPIDVTAINMNLTYVRDDLNSLSTSSTLAITNLNNTTTSILGYVNGYTGFSNLNTIHLNVSGSTTLNNNTTLLSSLNVSGFTSLNNNTTLLSSLNVSGFTTLNNNTTLFSSLNVSGFTSLNNNTTLLSSLNVSGFTTLNNNVSIISSLNVSGHSTLRSITLNKNNVDPSGDSLNFWYNTPGTYFTDNGFSSYFSLNSNVNTNTGLAVEPFIRVYNRMFKNGANTAMDLKTFGNSNSGVNSDVLIRIDSGGDPTPGTNSGKITYNINGSDKHIMTATGLGINITSPGLFALNVNGDTLISNHLNVSGTTKLNNNTTLFSSLNVSGVTTLNNNVTIISSLNVSGFTTLNNNVSIISSLNISGFTLLNNNTTLVSSLNVSGFTTLNNNVSIISSLNVSGFTTLSNNTTLLSSLNVSGLTRLNNNTTLISSLNVSGFTTLNNNTTLISSMNISGFTTLNNNVTIVSSLNVSGLTRLNNNTTLLSSLNVSGFTTLNNNTTLASSLNVSGFTSLNNNTTILSSLNVSGRTTIGKIYYNYIDSSFEVNKNLIVRPNVAGSGGDVVQLLGGNYTSPSYITINIDNDIVIGTRTTLTPNATITLDSPLVNVTGSLKCNNIGVKSPLFFTTNRTITIDGSTFSVYDIDLRKYTKATLLDGFNIRQFRVRHWLANADFEYSSVYYNDLYLKRYDIFMSNKNGLSIFSLSAPLENYYLRDTFGSHFLYRNNFDYVIYCSRGSSAVKVYFIIEDLL